MSKQAWNKRKSDIVESHTNHTQRIYDPERDVLVRFDPDTNSYVPTGESESPIEPYRHRPITPEEIAAVEAPHRIAERLIDGHMVHSVEESPTAHARASLYYSRAYMAAMAMITTAIVGVIWRMGVLGPGLAMYVFTWLCGWGISALIALYYNRRQGLHHSPSGIAHHEIDSRERIATHAIDQHVDLLKTRWEMDEDE